ncbi:uncharacterized protein METZ01_LOCUS335965 [marine metagenome]|uniref:Uncharacterized protein n=1 Tax=marine metagenome TaxID=408172 RepID=A0A382QFT4_9ZZZZ
MGVSCAAWVVVTHIKMFPAERPFVPGRWDLWG